MALRDSWHTFSSAPHRVMFFAGATQAVLAMLWWAYDLAARYTGLLPYIDWSLPARHGHQFLMIYGLFPLFFFGFIMTAGPRWLDMPPPNRRQYLSSLGLLSGGIALFYLGMASTRLLALLGMGLWLAGIGRASWWWLQTVRTSQQSAKQHPWTVAIALFAGMLGVVCFAIGELAGGDWNRAAVAIGIWWFVLPVFLAVAHRMIPFFTGNVVRPYKYWRPMWLLWAWLAGSALHGLMEIGGLPQWTWLLDLPLAGLSGYVSWRWGLQRSMKVWILAMLHIGFAWLSISLAVYGIHSLLLLTGSTGLGLVPLHVLMLGFIGTMLLAMATRVTLGHSGRQLAADQPTWVLFWLYHAVILLRTGAELFLSRPGHGYLAAALLWLACFGWWYRRYAVMYLIPRADGAPG